LHFFATISFKRYNRSKISMKWGYFMSGKQVDDYLKEGMYGSQKPLQKERDYFLGTLKERIVYALTIGQVKIGRASCRERVYIYDGAGAGKKRSNTSS